MTKWPMLFESIAEASAGTPLPANTMLNEQIQAV